MASKKKAAPKKKAAKKKAAVKKDPSMRDPAKSKIAMPDRQAWEDGVHVDALPNE